MSVPKKKTPKVQLAELRHGGVPFEKLLADDFARGYSPRMLEEKYDMHFTSIYNFARAYGLKPPGPMPLKERLSQMGVS